ncbi:MAG TPA: VWA domain-containing protein [Pyrinomonadaceae bacterium]|jgi:VWFA-related protein
MKKFVLFSSCVLCFSVVAAAQSGRRITAQPTPERSISSPHKDENPGYSESKPLPKRAVRPLPTMRNIPDAERKPLPPAPNAEAEILSDSEDEAIRVETNLVTIPVSVFDRNGLYIPNLAKENFQIFEDGAEQQIEFFATTENPFTVVLLLDTSPSTEYKIEEIQAAAIAFVNQLKPQDSVMVIEFDANVHVLTEPTTDRNLIFRGIRKADFGGGTSLYDSIDFTLRKRLNKISGRKAIILFTDGVDTTSTKTNYDSSLREVEEADATIFPIYYNTFNDQSRQMGGIFSPFPPPIVRGNTRQEYAMGRQYLKDLAESTGGRVFNADDSEGGLTRTFESIAEELRRQYSIGYIPQTAGQAGQRKNIKVRVNRPNLIIRARDSYIVGVQNKPATATPIKNK